MTGRKAAEAVSADLFGRTLVAKGKRGLVRARQGCFQPHSFESVLLLLLEIL